MLPSPTRCEVDAFKYQTVTECNPDRKPSHAGSRRAACARASALGAAWTRPSSHAARAELAERGYARMSVDAVAARAGVSKPTVYLRHPTKADLATAAIASMRAASRPAPTGDVRADLIAHLRLLRAGLERPFGMATLGTVLAEEHETPELLALFRDRLVAPRRRELRAVLAGGRERGELRADANLDIAVVGPGRRLLRPLPGRRNARRALRDVAGRHDPRRPAPALAGRRPQALLQPQVDAPVDRRRRPTGR